MNLEDVIEELRRINEPVPKPMRLPTPDEVDRVEHQIGVTFHTDYREYLLKASDVVYGVMEPCTVTPCSGHTNLLETAQAAWAYVGLPRDLLPICEDNGDYYCMTAFGDIVFWSHGSLSDERWPDLATWIKQVWIEGG